MLSNFFRMFPMPATMKHIPPGARHEAKVELTLNVLFSTLPLWFGGLVIGGGRIFRELKFDGELQGTVLSNLGDALLLSASQGELFFLTTATLGPTLYIGLTSFRNHQKAYPWVRPQFALAVLLALTATAFYFMSRDGDYADYWALVLFSLILYCVALLILYPVMAYEHARNGFNAQQEQQNQEQTFMAGYSNHRRAT